MQMSEGVEWAVHSCLNLAWADRPAIPVAKLAAYHELPTAYLNKQLQALCRHGILASVSGPRGGFRLARTPEQITVLDVVAAVEGPDDPFRCREIRQRGPNGGPPENYREPCAVKQVATAADLAWRRELAANTLVDVMNRAERQAPGLAQRVRDWFDG